MSYFSISYAQLRRKIENGAIIRWCGQAQDGHILVHLMRNNIHGFVKVDVDNVIVNWGSKGVVRNGGAKHPLTDVGYIPAKTDAFITYRNATVLGINISGSCEVKTGDIYNKIEGCSCGYDIELDMRGQVRGGFPLPSVPILSVALYCTCGYKRFISTLPSTSNISLQVHSQIELTSLFLDEVISHRPLWLIGWNCYSFDNTCLLYSLGSTQDEVDVISGEYNKYFRKLKIGIAGTTDYGYVMDIPGVYNVDPFLYMQRSPAHSSVYNNDFSLYGVAKKLGTTLKTDMPDLYSDLDPSEILNYNMNDSAIAAEIWVASKLEIEIPSLALASCAHVYDTVRYMTSVTARCPITAEALSSKLKIDWSECDKVLEYKGGKVLDPVRGIHDHVVVCDFSSMYPMIMMDTNISPETLEIIPASTFGNNEEVWFDTMYTYIRTGEDVARFPKEGSSLVKRLLIKFVTLRKQYRNTNSAYAGTLKVAANSIYGSLGYENSPLYNPYCSTSTTAIGRWCLNLACRTFEDSGLRVVYGDTDSCMVTAARSSPILIKEMVMSALRVLGDRLKETPLINMKMELESYYPRMILIEKKKYCCLTEEGNVIYKGVSVVRRDALGICKDACITISRNILFSRSTTETNELIAQYIHRIVDKCISGMLSHSDVSRVKKVNQRKCYVYMGKDKEQKTVPIDLSSNLVHDFDITYVLQSLKNEIHRITAPCGFGSTSDIVLRSKLFL